MFIQTIKCVCLHDLPFCYCLFCSFFTVHTTIQFCDNFVTILRQKMKLPYNSTITSHVLLIHCTRIINNYINVWFKFFFGLRFFKPVFFVFSLSQIYHPI